MAKTHSPRYPATSLPDAIDLVDKVWKKEERTPLSPEPLAKAMGFEALSGTARGAASALKKYGLLEKAGGGWRVSNRALQIIHKPKDSKDHTTALREAAMGVELIQSLMESHGRSSEPTLISHLITDLGFTKAGARTFAKAFFETKSLLESAGLDKISPEDPGESSESDDDSKTAKVLVGCTVQWTSQGVDRFDAPRKVLGLSDDGTYAFVEGTNTGIEVEQLAVIEATTHSPPEAESNSKTPPPNPFAKPLPWEQDKTKPGMLEDSSTIGGGVARLSWPEYLTPEQYDDLEYWVQGVLRKAKRSVDEGGGPPEEDDE